MVYKLVGAQDLKSFPYLNMNTLVIKLSPFLRNKQLWSAAMDDYMDCFSFKDEGGNYIHRCQKYQWQTTAL